MNDEAELSLRMLFEIDGDDAAAAVGKRMFEAIGNHFVEDQAHWYGVMNVQKNWVDLEVQRDRFGFGPIGLKQHRQQVPDVLSEFDASQVPGLIELFVN